MAARLHRGFTMIELLVAATISVILLLLAMPGYNLWVADSQIRVGAESVASGLRYAQAAAISHNLNSQFILGANGWSVEMLANPGVSIQNATFDEGGAKHATVLGVDAGAIAATTVAFNALGQVVPNATNLVLVNVSMPSMAGSRPLRVVIGDRLTGTGIKLCDPAFANPIDPKYCPP